MPFPTPPKNAPIATVDSDAEVTVTKGVTKNMGNFNSARVDVSVTLRVDPTKATILAVKATIERGIKIVDEALEKEINDLLL